MTGITAVEYIDKLPEDRKLPFQKLLSVVRQNLPGGFEETMLYGMITFVVPHSIYPQGYHVKPTDPVPFLSIASQKNHIAIYHMGLYIFPEIREWFIEEYVRQTGSGPDFGKSCIRFRKLSAIPFELIGELCKKISPSMYISKYREGVKDKNR